MFATINTEQVGDTRILHDTFSRDSSIFTPCVKLVGASEGDITPIGIEENPLRVFDQSPHNVQSAEKLACLYEMLGNFFNDALAFPFRDTSSKRYLPLLGAVAVNNFPANVLASRILNGVNSEARVSMANAESVGIVITGTFVGTITFESSVDGVTWASCFAMPIAGTAPVSTATAAGTFIASLGGMAFFRARCSAYTSGQPTVALTASVVTSLNQVYSPAATALLCTASQGGTWTVQIGNTPNTTAILASLRGTASTTGAYTKHRLMSAGTTNATSVKASAGMLYEAVLCNSNAAIRWVKFYNSASAPTPGSGTPSESIMVPANSTVVIKWGNGNPFTTGIAYCTVTGAADTDATAVTANDLSINLYYL